jgi:glycosyltransferase involved in cell wall biosynthesis
MNPSSIDFVILIPCFNNADGVMKSLNSIRYPENKYEVLVIDDGSIIPLNENEFQEKLPRVSIRITRLERNKGIVNALNTGLKALSSRNDVKYIARLDAGDLCSENRFTRQVDYLDSHPEISLLASWARFESSSDKGYDYITQTTHDKILNEMHFKCSFIHPSVMFKTEVLSTIGFYPENYPHAEDYAFFWKILKSYKGAVIPEKLVQIEFSEKNVSVENYRKQLLSRKRVIKEFGDQQFRKWIGLGILNLKLLLPVRWIQLLKSI